MRNAAFLSYSHALDGRLAPALQRGLQRFARRWHELRALTIFRDETSLSTNPHLWQSIESALAQSDFFILLASPSAAESVWVGREVAWWRANRPVDRLLIVLTEGEMEWNAAAGDFRQAATPSLPPALAGAFADEPRFLDLRWARNSDDLSLQHPRFKNAVADLAATLHGRPKDELLGEDVVLFRRQRLVRRLAVGLLAILTLAALAGGYVAVERAAEATRQQALAEKGQQDAEAARIEAVSNLTRAIEAKFDVTEAASRPDYSLALVYRLLTDPAFALSEEDRAGYLALLPELIGRAQVYRAAPAPAEESSIWIEGEPNEWFWASTTGLAGGVPVAFGTVQLSGGEATASRVELRSLLSGDVLAGPWPLADGDPGPQAKFVGDGLLVMRDADGTRVVVRLVRDDIVPLGLLRTLPAEEVYAEEAAVARDGLYVVDATLRWDEQAGPQGPFADGILWLDRAVLVPLADSARSDTGTADEPVLADLDDDHLLLIGPERALVVDARTGAAVATLPNPLPNRLQGGGLLDGQRLWLDDGHELLVYDLAAGQQAKRIVHQSDAVVRLRGAPGELVLVTCDKPWRILAGPDLGERAILPAVPCAADDTPAWQRVVGLLPDGTTIAFGAPHPADGLPALWLVPLGRPGAAQTLPVPYVITQFMVDSSGSWMLLDPGYGNTLVYLPSDPTALLQQAEKTLGDLAVWDLAVLLAL